MYCEKTVDPIEMLFEMVGRVGPRKDALDGVQMIKPVRGKRLGEIGLRNVTYKENAASAVQKRLNRSSCRLGR